MITKCPANSKLLSFSLRVFSWRCHTDFLRLFLIAEADPEFSAPYKEAPTLGRGGGGNKRFCNNFQKKYRMKSTKSLVRWEVGWDEVSPLYLPLDWAILKIFFLLTFEDEHWICLLSYPQPASHLRHIHISDVVNLKMLCLL